MCECRQSQQQPREKCFRTAIGPASRKNAPNDGSVQSEFIWNSGSKNNFFSEIFAIHLFCAGEKRPCPICGRLLSAKYLRTGKHQKTKQCKKPADAAVAAVLRKQEPECPYVISDVRTMDGDLLYCSEEEDEIPGYMKFEIDQECITTL